MKNIIYLLLILVLSSCMTVKRIQRNCDQFAKICVTETVKETIYRDTTIFRNDTIMVSLPKDTVHLTDTVSIVNDLVYLPTIYKQFGIIAADAGVQRSVLSVNAYLTDSAILHPIRDTIYLEKAIRHETVTNTVPVRYIPKIYQYAFWIVLTEIIILLLLTFLRFKGKTVNDILKIVQSTVKK